MAAKAASAVVRAWNDTTACSNVREAAESLPQQRDTNKRVHCDNIQIGAAQREAARHWRSRPRGHCRTTRSAALRRVDSPDARLRAPSVSASKAKATIANCTHSSTAPLHRRGSWTQALKGRSITAVRRTRHPNAVAEGPNDGSNATHSSNNQYWKNSGGGAPHSASQGPTRTMFQVSPPHTANFSQFLIRTAQLRR
jgi:hypothetical protein